VRQVELGPAVVEEPAQPVLDPRALRDQVLAVVEQQLDLARRALELGAGSVSMPSSSAARATASASIGSDLPRSREARRPASHQLRGDPDHPLAAREQEALELAGDVTAVPDRPDALRVD
jgi:hypothetical protein